MACMILLICLASDLQGLRGVCGRDWVRCKHFLIPNVLSCFQFKASLQSELNDGTAAASRLSVLYVLCRFTPMDFILPIILWLKVGKHSLIVRIVNWGIVVFYSIIALAGAIGSVQAIVNDVANYSVFADLF